MYQARVTVSTEASGLVVIEPRVGPHNKLRSANGMAEVRANVPVHLFVSNFGRSERRLLKNMVISNASKSPSLTKEVPEPLPCEVAQCQNIVADGRGSGSEGANGPVKTDGCRSVVNGAVEESTLASERMRKLKRIEDERLGYFNEVYTSLQEGMEKC